MLLAPLFWRNFKLAYFISYQFTLNYLSINLLLILLILNALSQYAVYKLLPKLINNELSLGCIASYYFFIEQWDPI